MRVVVVGIALAVIVSIGYSGIMLYHKIQISKGLVLSAVPYQKITNDHSISLLVLGDSTGVGVGAATPEDSVAGLFAAHMHATYVENLSVSGALTSDLIGQIQKAQLGSYTAILIQIGGNDIIRLHNAKGTATTLDTALSLLPKSDKIFVMPPGNVGSATLIPWLARFVFTNLNLKYHEEFQKVADAKGAHYVNLYRPASEDPFVLEPKVYLATDEFHPSSAGYALWYQKLISMYDMYAH